jgi:nicotinate-nucleotide pyrophosphorylase (carboxylating)
VIDLNALGLPDLFRHLCGGSRLRALLELARDEDLDEAGDVTTRSIVGPDQRGAARVTARAGGVVAGLEAVPVLLAVFGGGCAWEAHSADGRPCAAGETLGRLSGPLRQVLAVERTLLNLLGRAAGVATLTRRFVLAVASSGVLVCDTRKTMPGLRVLDKYAVRCGGGHLHRLGLYDAALYKDNHLAHIPAPELARRVAAAAALARRESDLRFVEVEVDTLEQLNQILSLPAGTVDLVLLDNMDPASLRRAVEMRSRTGAAVALEASGGITLDTVAAVAATGVDRIAVGAMTHSAAALELGLDAE